MKNRFLSFSGKEIFDLLKAWAAISLAFAIVMVGFPKDLNFMTALAVSAITVGSGFIVHELSHKFLAQRYGCIAEFRANNTSLIIAILISFLGFVYAAPGGVFIGGHVDRIRYGRISAAGIAANIVMATLFSIFIFTPLAVIGIYGLMINSWLAIFNLIPIGNFDGKKVYRWNKTIYFTFLIISGILLIAGFLFSS